MTAEYRLVIFDMEGTLVTTKSGGTFRQTEDDWVLLPGRAECIRTLAAAGTRLAIASNQGGIAFGYLRHQELHDALYDAIRPLDGTAWGKPHAIALYYCPHHPNGNPDLGKRLDCFCRKPKPGMLLRAMLDAEVGPRDTLMVGDRPEDEGAASAAGVDFRWADDFFDVQGTSEPAENGGADDAPS